MTEYIVSLEPSEYDETIAHRSYPVKMRKGGTWERSSVSCTYCTDELTEVVRCGDCKWYARENCPYMALKMQRGLEKLREDRFARVCLGVYYPDGFCAWGEKRKS